jgi:hypothetical protein
MPPKPLSLALAAAALALPAIAQDGPGPNPGFPSGDVASGGVATLNLAHRLYQLGVAQDDVVMVLAAARLASSVRVEAGPDPAPFDAKTEAAALSALDPSMASGSFPDDSPMPGDPVVAKWPTDPADPAAATGPSGQGGTERHPLELAAAARLPGNSAPVGSGALDADAADGPVPVEAMFAKAQDLAGDDQVLLGLIRDAMAESTRGRVGEVVRLESRLGAGMTDVWKIPFQGNSLAEVAVQGDGSSNLDVVITDESGNQVCHEASLSDSIYCDWLPTRDGDFFVAVQNRGDAPNRYFLMTN